MKAYHEKSRTLFDYDVCRGCGEDVRTPDSIYMTPSVARKLELENLAFFTDDLPPEAWFDVESGEERCPNCEVKHETE